MSFVALATEDELSEAVGIKLLIECCPNLSLQHRLGRKGNGYLRARLANFNQMARYQHVLILTDLDAAACPLRLLRTWAGNLRIHDRLSLRIAVREIESWLLADHVAMRALLGSDKVRLPEDPDMLAYPKAKLLQLAESAPRAVREDICRRQGAVASQGLGYNARLSAFVREHWMPHRAAERSSSLQRACRKLNTLR